MANISIDVADNEARQDLQDLEDYVDSAAFDKQSLSVTENGTYTAPAGKAYSPVVVDVPNTYAQSDEGKVVSSGTLVSQTTKNVTTNGTYDTTTNNSVVVDVQGSPSSVSPKAVNFYDYDGTIVQSYSTSEFAELTEMPENPTHNGLTAQGWNWSLVDAKAYVASYGKLNIGQKYITDDGATRLHIQLTDGRPSPVLGLCPNGTLTIDWGDGTPEETMTGTSVTTLVYLPHVYSQAGEYTISITPTSGSTFGFGERNSTSTVICKNNTASLANQFVYINSIININLGNGITTINRNAFNSCYSLSSITIPNSVTSIGNSAFRGCYSLSSITIPNSVTIIDDSILYGCYSLSSITIPNSVTSIGNSAFQGCYSLSSITIPNSVTTIVTRAFYNCYSLSSITIPNGITSINNETFGYCYSLSSITIPNSVTSIGSGVFYYCYSLSSIIISNSVTSIGSSAFYNCYSLSPIIIPNSVTSIGISAFYSCYGLGYLKFTNATPPTVNSANAFSNLPTDCVIYVPRGSLSDYTSASNYPSSSTYTYVEY